MGCFYYNTLKIGFARTVTYEAINEQFVAIEEAFRCLAALVDTLKETEEVVYIHKPTEEYLTIDPGLGSIQFVTTQGDVELDIAVPDEEDPKLITLVVADGGDGSGGDSRFNFPAGTAWTTDANGTTMDSKAWDTMGLAGDYGAIVKCIWDGIGWVYLVFGRNDIDFAAAADVTDLFNWR